MLRRIIGTILAIAALGLVAAYLLAMHASTPPAAITKPPTLADTKSAEQRVTQQFQYPELLPTVPTPKAHSLKSSTPSQPRLATIRISQDDLNTLLRGDPMVQARMRKANVTAVQLTLEPPNVVDMHCWVDFEDDNREVTVSGTLTPTSDGKVAFKTDAASIGMLPLPSNITATQIDQAAATFGNAAESNLPISVQNVAVDGSNLVLTGPKK